jgi:hypothetical protein
MLTIAMTRATSKMPPTTKTLQSRMIPLGVFGSWEAAKIVPALPIMLRASHACPEYRSVPSSIFGI